MFICVTQGDEIGTQAATFQVSSTDDDIKGSLEYLLQSFEKIKTRSAS